MQNFIFYFTFSNLITRSKIDNNFIELKKLFGEFKDCYSKIINFTKLEKSLIIIENYYKKNTHVIFKRFKDIFNPQCKRKN